MFDEKQIKLGLVIFLAVVAASLVLQRFQEASVMQHYAQMQKFQQQQVQQMKAMRLREIESMLGKNAAEHRLSTSKYTQQLN